MRENADTGKLKERESQSCSRTAWSPLSSTRGLQEPWIQSLPSTSLHQRDKKKKKKKLVMNEYGNWRKRRKQQQESLQLYVMRKGECTDDSKNAVL